MVGKKFSLIFGILVLSLVLVGVVSACETECVPATDDTGWIFFGSISGDIIYSGSGSGNYVLNSVNTVYVNDYGWIKIQVPELEFSGEHTLTFIYSIGSDGQTGTENFEVHCGGEIFSFPDNDDNGESWHEKSIVCDLSSDDLIKFKSTGNDGSVHFKKFKITGEKTCPLPPTCGPLTDDYDCDKITDKNDNCKYVWNPSQTDSDFDGKGDVCDEPKCGNGYLENQVFGGKIWEQCDDGNTISGDGCSSTCQIEEIPEPYCGDGIVNQISEECDDGNNINDDGCSAQCVIEQNPPEPPQETKSSSGNVLDYSECLPNWKCFGWSECSNGVMTRTCYDSNNCEFSYNKPLESSVCVDDKTESVKISNSNIWVFFIGVILLIVLLIILINLAK